MNDLTELKTRLERARNRDFQVRTARAALADIAAATADYTDPSGGYVHRTATLALCEIDNFEEAHLFEF